MLRHALICLASGLATGLMIASPAQALTMKECSAKYRDAQKANTLKGMKWNDFRKAECGPGATMASDTKAKKKTAAKSDDDDDAKGLSMKECSAKYQAAQKAGTLDGMKWNDFRKAECSDDADSDANAEAPAGASTKAVFPKAVAPKYAKESPGKARMETCLDQYKINKDKDANGGLKWIMKGGGYYSECTKKLKGAA